MLALYLVIFSPPPSILSINGSVLLEIETISHLFHSPWRALMWPLRLSANKMNSHICCTCCSRLSFGSLLYRHSPAQAVTNRGRATSTTASTHCALDTRIITSAGFILSNLNILGGKLGTVLEREKRGVFRNCDSSCCQLEIPAEINCVAPHRSCRVTA